MNKHFSIKALCLLIIFSMLWTSMVYADGLSAIVFHKSGHDKLGVQTQIIRFADVASELHLGGIVLKAIAEYAVSDNLSLHRRWQGGISDEIDRELGDTEVQFKVFFSDSSVYMVFQSHLYRFSIDNKVRDPFYMSCLKQYEDDPQVKKFDNDIVLAGKKRRLKKFIITTDIDDFIADLSQYMAGNLTDIISIEIVQGKTGALEDVDTQGMKRTPKTGAETTSVLTAGKNITLLKLIGFFVLAGVIAIAVFNPWNIYIWFTALPIGVKIGVFIGIYVIGSFVFSGFLYNLHNYINYFISFSLNKMKYSPFLLSMAWAIAFVPLCILAVVIIPISLLGLFIYIACGGGISSLNNNWNTRILIMVLGKIDVPFTISLLEKFLKAKNIHILKGAISALGKSKDLRAVELLSKLLLEDTNRHITKAVVEELWNRRDPRTLKHLLNVLIESKNPDVQIMVIEKLGEAGYAFAFGPLSEILAADGLGLDLYCESARSLLRILEKNSGLTDEYISTFGDDYKGKLSAYNFIKNREWDRAVALGVSAVPALEVALRDKDWRICVDAVSAVGRILPEDISARLARSNKYYKRAMFLKGVIHELEMLSTRDTGWFVEETYKDTEDLKSAISSLAAVTLPSFGYYTSGGNTDFPVHYYNGESDCITRSMRAQESLKRAGCRLVYMETDLEGVPEELIIEASQSVYNKRTFDHHLMPLIFYKRWGVVPVYIILPKKSVKTEAQTQTGVELGDAPLDRRKKEHPVSRRGEGRSETRLFEVNIIQDDEFKTISFETEDAQIQSKIKYFDQQMLERVLKKLSQPQYYGMAVYQFIRTVEVVDNLNGLRFQDDGPLSEFVDKKVKIDIDAFRNRNEALLFDVLEHEFLHNVLNILKIDEGLDEVVATYRSVLRFLTEGKKYREAVIKELEKEGNGLDESGDYLRLLRRLESLDDLRDKKIVSAVVRYLLTTPRYEGLREKLGIVDKEAWEKAVRQTEERMEAALEVYDDLIRANARSKEIKGEGISDKLTRQVRETEHLAIRVIKSFNGVIRIEESGELSEPLAGMIAESVKVASQMGVLKNTLHDYIKQKDAESSEEGYCLVLDNIPKEMGSKWKAEIRELQRYKRKDGTTPLFEIVDSVDKAIAKKYKRKRIIHLTDIAIDYGKLRKKEEKYGIRYLPLPYLRSSLYIAASLALAEGDVSELKKINPLALILIENLYSRYLGILDPGQWKQLFTAPWLILPKVQSQIEGLNNLREVLPEIERAA